MLELVESERVLLCSLASGIEARLTWDLKEGQATRYI